MATIPVRIALLHIITYLGSLVFALAHLFHSTGALAEGLEHAGHDHGHDHTAELTAMADVNSPGLWAVGVFYLLGLVAPLLAVIGRGRAVAIAALVVGGLYALLNVVDGVLHAVGDGSVPLLLIAVVGVGVPGAFAAVAGVRALRASEVAE